MPAERFLHPETATGTAPGGPSLPAAPALPGTTDRVREALAGIAESVWELTGESMSPTLERGWKVRVEPLDRPLEAGDVILLDSAGGTVIHRYLGTVTLGSPARSHVVHAGDSSLRPGVVPASQVRGRVSEVVRPPGRRLLALRELPRERRRRLSRFAARWRLYAWLRRFADAVPGLSRLLTAVVRAARR